MFFSGVSDINAPPNTYPEPHPSTSSEQDAGKVTSKSTDSNNAQATGPNSECDVVPENPQPSETKSNPLEHSTESDQDGSDSESSSSVDSSSSSSSGVSSVDSANELSQEPPDSNSVQVDVPASMITTALQSPETKEDTPTTEEPVPKPDVDPDHNKVDSNHQEVDSGRKEIDSMHKDIEKNFSPHPSVSRIRRLPSDIQDPDDFLVHLAVTLSKIHDIFYTEYDCSSHQSEAAMSSHIHTPDLKEIIPRVRQSVLQGCNILFTGVIPTNMPPERCPEWNTARAFGAKIHSTLVGIGDKNCQPTTHLIVGRVGTSKLHEARRMPGVKIVNCSWLWTSAERWQHADEALYSVKESKLPHKEEKQHQNKKSTTEASGNRRERLMSTGSASVPLLSDEELVEMDKEVDAEMDDDDDMDSDNSDGENEMEAKDRLIEGSRKRKLSESPQSLSTSSDLAKSSDDEDDDDEFGALLEAQIS